MNLCNNYPLDFLSFSGTFSDWEPGADRVSYMNASCSKTYSINERQKYNPMTIKQMSIRYLFGSKQEGSSSNKAIVCLRTIYKRHKAIFG